MSDFEGGRVRIDTRRKGRITLNGLALACCTFVFAAAGPNAWAQEFPLADDVESPEAVVTAAYRSLDRAPGDPFQWDRFRSLFVPGATLVPNTEQTGGEFRVLSPEGFIAWIDSVITIGGPNDKGFTEEEVSNVVERYGDVAHVFSTYQKRFWEGEEVLGRGINSFQLVRHDDRWWIVGIVWDEEAGAGPIPPQYLP